jgi:hypothetical protein
MIAMGAEMHDCCSSRPEKPCKLSVASSRPDPPISVRPETFGLQRLDACVVRANRPAFIPAFAFAFARMIDCRCADLRGPSNTLVAESDDYVLHASVSGGGGNSTHHFG